MSAQTAPTISALLGPDRVRVHLGGVTDKSDLIDALVDTLEGHPDVLDLDEVRRGVRGREAIMSTGVGKGLALPHSKTNAVRDTVAAFATLDKGVDFDAIDEQPVRLAFLLVGTEEPRSTHIRVLSRVSRVMNRDAVRQELLEATTRKAILDVFARAEASL